MTKSLVPLVLFILNIIPLFYLSSRGVESANFYFLLALMFPSLIFLIFWFFEGKMGDIFPVIPIKKKGFQSSQLFYLGVLLVIGLRLIGFVTSKIMSPFLLFSQKVYQAYVIGSSRFMEWFIIGFSASIMEEILFGVTFMVAGILVGYWLRNAWGLDFGAKGNYYFHITIGSLFSIIPFVVFHLLNQVYVANPTMFIIAGLFRVLVNFLIWGVFGSLMIGVGIHLANNTLTLSSATIVGAFTSPYGLIIMLIFGTMLYSAIKHIGEADTTFGLGDIW